MKMTKRRRVGQPEEVEKIIRKRGPMGTTRTDSRSCVSKALFDVIVQKHGSSPEDALQDMLLPGILDHVAIAHIIPKLGWKDALYRLSSVSQTWLRRMQSRQIHDERVFYRCTDTFIVLPYIAPMYRAERLENCPAISIALYSMKENHCYELPPLPPFPKSFPGFNWHTSVSLDGKVYVMEVYTSIGGCSKKRATGRMLKFDVAGKGGWQPCANRQIVEDNSTCGVLNGKIYAIDGGDAVRKTYDLDVLHDIGARNYRFKNMSEVYNPQDNTWTWMKSVKYRGLSDKVWVFGDKLVVRRKMKKSTSTCNYLLLYDPTADDWTELNLSLSVVDEFSLSRMLDVKKCEMFSAHGNFYMMDATKIYIYDSEKEMWKFLHASSFTGIGMGPVNSLVVVPRQILVVGEELVAVVLVRQTANSKLIVGQVVLRSRSRLGGDNKEIVWHKAGASIYTLYGISVLLSARIKDAWQRWWEAKKMEMIPAHMWQGDGRDGTSGALKNPRCPSKLQYSCAPVPL